MFGRKKMYKQGLADAMHAYEDFGKKQEAALAKMRSDVQAGKAKLEDALNNLGDDLNGIYRYLNAQEKAALYHLTTAYDVKSLEEEEQQLLLAVLFQLAENAGPALNDYQRTYLHSIQRYLGIPNPQTRLDDLSVVGDIDSGLAQKTILQTVLEFFYLQDGDELSDAQEDFLADFSVNRKQATAIENAVSRLYNAVGIQGLAEKYGSGDNAAQGNGELIEALNKMEELFDSLNCFSTGTNRILEYLTPGFEVLYVLPGSDKSFHDKDTCQRAAEGKMDELTDTVNAKLTEQKYSMSCAISYGRSTYEDISRQLDNKFQSVRDLFKTLRNTKTIPTLNEMDAILKKSEILDRISQDLDGIASRHYLSSRQFYRSINIEEMATTNLYKGLFGKTYFKDETMYGYNISDAFYEMLTAGNEECAAFSAEVVSRASDYMNRYILEPIRPKLSQLRNILTQ